MDRKARPDLCPLAECNLCLELRLMQSPYGHSIKFTSDLISLSPADLDVCARSVQIEIPSLDRDSYSVSPVIRAQFYEYILYMSLHCSLRKR